MAARGDMDGRIEPTGTAPRACRVSGVAWFDVEQILEQWKERGEEKNGEPFGQHGAKRWPVGAPLCTCHHQSSERYRGITVQNLAKVCKSTIKLSKNKDNAQSNASPYHKPINHTSPAAHSMTINPTLILPIKLPPIKKSFPIATSISQPILPHPTPILQIPLHPINKRMRLPRLLKQQLAQELLQFPKLSPSSERRRSGLVWTKRRSSN